MKIAALLFLSVLGNGQAADMGEDYLASTKAHKYENKIVESSINNGAPILKSSYPVPGGDVEILIPNWENILQKWEVQKGATCWAASAFNILTYYGANKYYSHEDAIRDYKGEASMEAAYWPNASATVIRSGSDGSLGADWSSDAFNNQDDFINIIRDEILAGRPSIIFYGQSGKIKHAVVVIGISRHSESGEPHWVVLDSKESSEDPFDYVSFDMPIKVLTRAKKIR